MKLVSLLFKHVVGNQASIAITAQWAHFSFENQKTVKYLTRDCNSVLDTTLPFWIVVHARLLIWAFFSSLHVLIRVCMFIKFLDHLR